MEHIVPGKHTQQPPSWFAGVVINTAPHSFVEAMASSKSNAWLNAMAKEFASLEQHQVIKEATLRFLLGYCASNDFDVQQMDVKMAFLHGDLNKDIFI
ncbi:hypothetical protein O181_000916 [Austropuccinia psidii MF-1]|uniref:Reverse transcriptase Ty1/copia-type domain-containing protein n=1 Tax=Austropuccinia psidii MF-1 TaxID=1389203 RepID=A0A9Q3GBZ0_9BASI|nr:hypothetical protein [Austropuccinia psidii MF-1]